MEEFAMCPQQCSLLNKTDQVLCLNWNVYLHNYLPFIRTLGLLVWHPERL